MALNQKALRIIEPFIRNAKILSFGYPDILCSKEKIKEIFGIDVVKSTPRGRWHTGKDLDIPESQEFFEELGSSIDCIDIAKDFGVERVVDLNYPQDLGKYDVVLDPGTIEHCFNIGVAVMNAANAVKVGGRVFHVPPMTMMNHGFYNICPTMLYDFYAQNGWGIEYMASFGRSGRVPIEETTRFEAASEAALYFVARRNSDDDMIFPIQTKYLKKMEKDNAKRAA